MCFCQKGGKRGFSAVGRGLENVTSQNLRVLGWGGVGGKENGANQGRNAEPGLWLFAQSQ